MSDPIPPAAPIEQAKLFNEFQTQWRARIEAGIKLVTLLAGGMLTLSVGAVLGNSPSKIPSYLVGYLAWSWGLLFYSIAAGMLMMAGMVVATFHMSERMRKRMQSGGAPSVFFVATWRWLRIANATMGVSALLSFLAGLVLISQVAIGVAHAAAAKPSPTAVTISAAPEQPSAAPTAAPTRQSSGESTAEQDRAAKAALDQKLVDFNGDLAHYTGFLVVLGALQIIGVGVQLVLLLFAFHESRRASDIARDAMVAGQRAFVFAVNVVGLWDLDPATQQYNWRLRALIRNSGNTPTKNLTMHTSCLLLNHELPKNFDFDSNMTAKIGTGLLGPKADGFGGVAPVSPEPALTPQDLIDVQKGRKWLYFMGWLRYHDVFPETPQHITRYCWLVTPSGDPTIFTPANPSGVTFPSIHHFEGNCADDECKPWGG
jgi:hypothetical protein